MKIQYQFANETVEIDVSEEWGNILVDLDHQEFNSNRKETRRHVSFDAFNLDGSLFPSNDDVISEVIKRDEHERVHTAIEKLTPQQKELVRRVHFEQNSQSDIAREAGVSRMAITNRMKKIYANLKKDFD